MKQGLNTELQALQNAVDYFGLDGFTVNQKAYEDKRRTTKMYFLHNDKTGETISPVLDYKNLNHFIHGYGKALKLTPAASPVPDQNKMDDLEDDIYSRHPVPEPNGYYLFKKYKPKHNQKIIYWMGGEKKGVFDAENNIITETGRPPIS